MVSAILAVSEFPLMTGYGFKFSPTLLHEAGFDGKHITGAPEEEQDSSSVHPRTLPQTFFVGFWIRAIISLSNFSSRFRAKYAFSLSPFE